MNYVIEAQSLTKHYGPKKALDMFSLKVKENSIFGLLGPNGAGKTTAIEIMLGLKKASDGEVKVLGVNPEKDFLKIANSIGAMLQEGGINPGIKPKEALALYAAFYSNPRDVNELLELVNLKDVDIPLRRLSGGQAQSLSLALALIPNPKLVFLDEPTVGMDPNARRRTWEIIQELKEKGTTVVLTTHHMDEAEFLCDDIAIVANGKVIAQGDLDELTKSQHGNSEFVFGSEIDTKELERFLNVKYELLSENKMQVNQVLDSQIILDIARFGKETNNLMVSMTSQSKKLEDIFIELTNQSQDMVPTN